MSSSPPLSPKEQNHELAAEAPGSELTKTPKGRGQAKKVKDATHFLFSSLGPQASGVARLKALLAALAGEDRILIVISADPDALASAAAVKRLLWRRVGQVTVSSINQIKRPDNLQLVKALGFPLAPWPSVKVEQFDRLVMVDSQPNHSSQTENLPFDVIIDHHAHTPVNNAVKLPTYIDVRPEYGATATMMVNYLRAAAIKPNPRLATALFYAIKTDTQNFVRQGQLEDMRAFRWLYPSINQMLLSDIERGPIARSSFKRIVSALDNAVFHRTHCFSFLENADHPDTLVIVADFLIQVTGINQVVVGGVCGEKLVIIFRGGGTRKHLGKLAKSAFGPFGSAGGHKNMARAEIPLENLEEKIRSKDALLSRFITRRLEAFASH